MRSPSRMARLRSSTYCEFCALAMSAFWSPDKPRRRRRTWYDGRRYDGRRWKMCRSGSEARRPGRGARCEGCELGEEGS